MSYKYCPHCGNQLPPPIASGMKYPDYTRPESDLVEGPVQYNQTLHWKELVSIANDIQQGKSETRFPDSAFSGGDTVIHMIFDNSVSPQGGLMNSLIRSVSATQPSMHQRLSPEELSAMGYICDEVGKVIMVEDIPVGGIYALLKYWGGEKQYKRWHMSEPVTVNPARKGDPCFIDETMVAVMAKWKDSERVVTAIETLRKILSGGTKDLSGVGLPRLIDIAWVK